jgi:hypothetical protein
MVCGPVFQQMRQRWALWQCGLSELWLLVIQTVDDSRMKLESMCQPDLLIQDVLRPVQWTALLTDLCGRLQGVRLGFPLAIGLGAAPPSHLDGFLALSGSVESRVLPH